MHISDTIINRENFWPNPLFQEFSGVFGRYTHPFNVCRLLMFNIPVVHTIFSYIRYKCFIWMGYFVQRPFVCRPGNHPLCMGQWFYKLFGWRGFLYYMLGMCTVFFFLLLVVPFWFFTILICNMILQNGRKCSFFV